MVHFWEDAITRDMLAQNQVITWFLPEISPVSVFMRCSVCGYYNGKLYISTVLLLSEFL